MWRCWTKWWVTSWWDRTGWQEIPLPHSEQCTFKIYKLFISGLFHWLFFDYDWPRVTETIEGKTTDRREWLYGIYSFPLSHFTLSARFFQLPWLPLHFMGSGWFRPNNSWTNHWLKWELPSLVRVKLAIWRLELIGSVNHKVHYVKYCNNYDCFLSGVFPLSVSPSLQVFATQSIWRMRLLLKRR